MLDFYHRNPSAAEEVEDEDFDDEVARYMRQSDDDDWETVIDEGDDGQG